MSGGMQFGSGGVEPVMTTDGDLVYYDSGRERLPIGSTGKGLTVSSGLPAWET
jgi:hypothetical protein